MNRAPGLFVIFSDSYGLCKTIVMTYKVRSYGSYALTLQFVFYWIKHLNFQTESELQICKVMIAYFCIFFFVVFSRGCPVYIIQIIREIHCFFV